MTFDINIDDEVSTNINKSQKQNFSGNFDKKCYYIFMVVNLLYLRHNLVCKALDLEKVLKRNSQLQSATNEVWFCTSFQTQIVMRNFSDTKIAQLI